MDNIKEKRPLCTVAQISSCMSGKTDSIENESSVPSLAISADVVFSLDKQGGGHFEFCLHLRNIAYTYITLSTDTFSLKLLFEW